MQQVNVPGVGMLQFPDGMSQDAMSAAIQKNYPQTVSHSTQSPDDSPFLKGIKDVGNEAVRVGAKAVTGLPLMAGDFFTALGNAGKRVMGHPASEDNPYPSDVYDQQLDQAFAPPQGAPGKISEGLSTLIASLGLPGPTAPAQAVRGLTGADAVKASTLTSARNASEDLLGKGNGYVVPPNQTTGAPLGARIANGYGGANETNNMARAANQPVTNALAATDIGLPKDASLTTARIKDVINKAAQKGYAPLRDIGDVPVDQAHLDLVKELAGADRGAANIDPRLGNPQIAELADALTPKGQGIDALSLNPKNKTYDSGDLVDAISALRGKAADAYAAGNKTLGAAYKKAANGFESLIDRHLQSKGDDAADLLNDFRQSRTTIAKAHDILGALNPATGDVDAKALGELIDSGDKLTGGIGEAAKFGRAFGDVAGRSKGEPNPLTAFQSNTAGASGITGAALNLLGRPTARNYALSRDVQLGLLQPKGKTLTRKALDAVFSNPSAFGALYEDQNKALGQ